MVENSQITVKLAGASHAWLEMNTSWGTDADQVDKAAREAVMDAAWRKVGKGSVHTATMTDEQAESVWRILESIAGAGESMTAEERGDDAYAFRAMRRDAGRIQESLTAAGWKFVPQGYFTRSVAPGEEL